MKLTKRYIELENKTDAESIRELGEINIKFEELDDRLNALLGNTFKRKLWKYSLIDLRNIIYGV